MSLTVYSLPNCVQCEATKRMFAQAGVEYAAVDLTQDDEAMKMVQSLGYNAAPVVIAGDEHWSGFRIEKIKKVIAETASQVAV